MSIHTCIIKLTHKGSPTSVKPFVLEEIERTLSSKIKRINNCGRIFFMFLVIVPNSILAIIGMNNFSSFSGANKLHCPT